MWLRKLIETFRPNSSRVYLERFLKQAAASLPEGSLVLDAGAGDCMYQPLFSHANYESADFCQVDKSYGKITYECDLSSIPVQDNRFDAVICTQVLEHVPEPEAVLRELNRILKPTGKLWLSAPLFYNEHEIPYDYYRYTQYGLKYLLQLAGFEIERIEWLEGYYGTLAYQLETATITLPLNPKSYGAGLFGFLAALTTLLLKPIFFLASVLFTHSDLRYKNDSIGYCKNYAIVALKSNSEGEYV